MVLMLRFRHITAGFLTLGLFTGIGQATSADTLRLAQATPAEKPLTEEEKAKRKKRPDGAEQPGAAPPGAKKKDQTQTPEPRPQPRALEVPKGEKRPPGVGQGRIIPPPQQPTEQKELPPKKSPAAKVPLPGTPPPAELKKAAPQTPDPKERFGVRPQPPGGRIIPPPAEQKEPGLPKQPAAQVPVAPGFAAPQPPVQPQQIAPPKQPVLQVPPVAPGVLQPPPPQGQAQQSLPEAPKKLEDLKQQRRERTEAGGRTVIEEPDKRIIIRERDRVIIRHDETDRFRRIGRDVRTERRGNITVNFFVRPDGGQVVSEVDTEGRLLRRYRRTREGREIILIDNRRHFEPGLRAGLFGVVVNLPPAVVRIPRRKYIVEYQDASPEDLYEALSAPPIEPLERDYSLEEVRRSFHLRERMRRIDLDAINFEFGSWEVGREQYPRLERLATAMTSLLSQSPDEVFLIEGHTDAVGSDVDNLTLSDRRAEAVAVILTETFGVPPENLVTQGYGEQHLKVNTQGPERLNRRVAARRVTPLLSQSYQAR